MNFHVAALAVRLKHSLNQWFRGMSAYGASHPDSAPTTIRTSAHPPMPHRRVVSTGCVAAPAQSIKRKPLRVIQVPDLSHQRASVGRLVISGSMADVCAELDRLAAWESSVQSS